MVMEGHGEMDGVVNLALKPSWNHMDLRNPNETKDFSSQKTLTSNVPGFAKGCFLEGSLQSTLGLKKQTPDRGPLDFGLSAAWNSSHVLSACRRNFAIQDLKVGAEVWKRRFLPGLLNPLCVVY